MVMVQTRPTPATEVPPLAASREKNEAYHYLSRFLQLVPPYEITLSQTELTEVAKYYPDIPADNRKLSTRYLTWRKSALVVAMVPYFVSVILFISSITHSLNKKSFLESIFPESTSDFDWKEYYQFFERYWLVNAAVQVLYALSLVFSFLCVLVAIKHWGHFRTSRIWLRRAYLLSFAVPFILLLIAPFKQSVDGPGAELKLCQDTIASINSDLADPRNQFECVLDDVLCKSKNSDEWSIKLRLQVDECGLLKDPQTETCPFGDQVATAMIANMPPAESGGVGRTGVVPNEAVHTICGDSNLGYCQRCLLSTQPGNDRPYCADLLAAMTIPQIYNDCERCFTPVLPQLETMDVANKDAFISQLRDAGVEDNMPCSAVCVSLVTESFLSSQIAAHTSAKPSACINDEMMENFAAITQLALQMDKITYAVGAYQAAMALIALFPASFSLMYGAIRGATLCKILLPWSRLPGYLVGASIVFCLPMFTALLAVINQLVGDTYCTIAFLFLLGSLLVWLPEHKRKDYAGTLAPQSHLQATKELTTRGNYSVGLKALCGVFLIFFAAALRQQMDKEEAEAAAGLIKGDIYGKVVQFICDCYGKAYLSFIFCADTVMHVVGYISIGELGLDKECEDIRKSELLDVSALNKNFDTHRRKNRDRDDL